MASPSVQHIVIIREGKFIKEKPATEKFTLFIVCYDWHYFCQSGATNLN